jgi:hypothetical protein
VEAGHFLADPFLLDHRRVTNFEERARGDPAS